MSLVSIIYPIIIIAYLLIGAAIVFHMLYYRINRRVATVMFFIYLVGSIFLLISNFSFFGAVDWQQIFSNISF